MVPYAIANEQIPRQITVGLRLRGVDVLTVQEDNCVGLPDSEVLDRASQLQRVLFSDTYLNY